MGRAGYLKLELEEAFPTELGHSPLSCSSDAAGGYFQKAAMRPGSGHGNRSQPLPPGQEELQ